MANRIKFTPQKKKRFLLVLAEIGHVQKACASVDITPQCAYEHRRKDEKFRAKWDVAIDEAMRNLEAVARRRAFGYDDPLHHLGRLTGDTVERYDTTLCIFLMKAHWPEKYRDNYRVEHAGGIDHEHSGEVHLYLPDNGRDKK